MEIRLKFLGAARNVTGSKIMVEALGQRLLIDYGMVQEWKLKERNWKPLPVSPDRVDAVLLTHAHLDHCGLLPRLVDQGFRGKIHCTRATAALSKVVLLDSAHIQEEDARFKQLRHKREGRVPKYPATPLYTEAEVRNCLPRFQLHPYAEPVVIGEGITAIFHDAGHILGSSSIELHLRDDDEEKVLVFSGDVGRANKPILRDPSFVERADLVVIESTYGDRLHRDGGDVKTVLADAINHAVESGGNILIPSFAIGRSQEILYHLHELLSEDRIPHLPIFFDSPMAIKVTEIISHFPGLFDQETLDLLNENDSPFEFADLHMTRSPEQSKAINRIKGTAIIIAGSGMCTGGRIKHHIEHNIARKDSTMLFVGYQAEGTLGGLISRGAKTIRLHGQEFGVHARIAQIYGMSAHADQQELLDWLGHLQQAPQKVLVNHGDEDAALTLADKIRETHHFDVDVPQINQTVVLR